MEQAEIKPADEVRKVSYRKTKLNLSEACQKTALNMLQAGFIRYWQTAYKYDSDPQSEKHGLYVELSPEAALSAGYNFLSLINYNATSPAVEELYKRLSAFTAEILEPQQAETEIARDRITIPMKNGIYDFYLNGREEMKPYQQGRILFSKIDYDPAQVNGEMKTPMFDYFVRSSLLYRRDRLQEKIAEADKIENFILEMLGYCLYERNELSKAFIFVGDGRNGKGVLMWIIKYLVGFHNSCDVDMKGIEKGDVLWMCDKKKVAFSIDADPQFQLDTETIKRMIAGEPVVVRRKYKDERQMTFSAKLFLLTNDIPFSRNTGASVRERFIIFPFFKEFSQSERDYELVEKLKMELPAIFRKALEGLKRLLKRGHFDLPERCAKALEEYLTETDTIRQWMKENDFAILPERHEYGVKPNEFYSHYKMWCIASGVSSLGKFKFYKRLRDAGAVRGRSGTADMVFINIRADDQYFIKLRRTEEAIKKNLPF